MAWPPPHEQTGGLGRAYRRLIQVGQRVGGTSCVSCPRCMRDGRSRPIRRTRWSLPTSSGAITSRRISRKSTVATPKATGSLTASCGARCCGQWRGSLATASSSHHAPSFRHPETFAIGHGVFIGEQALLHGRFDGRCLIGNGTWIGPQAYLDARDLVIGEHVGWGPGARLLGSAHTGRARPTFR